MHCDRVTPVPVWWTPEFHQRVYWNSKLLNCMPRYCIASDCSGAGTLNYCMTGAQWWLKSKVHKVLFKRRRTSFLSCCPNLLVQVQFRCSVTQFLLLPILMGPCDNMRRGLTSVTRSVPPSSRSVLQRTGRRFEICSLQIMETATWSKFGTVHGLV